MELNRDSVKRHTHIFECYTFHEGGTIESWAKDSLYNKRTQSIDYPCWEKMELGLYLMLYTEVNFRGLVNLNVKSKKSYQQVKEYHHEHLGQKCL